METNWAAEHLQTIRTLMERSAVYRRALAPIMTCAGVLGITGGIVGRTLKIQAAEQFVMFWGGVAVAAVVAAFLLVRRQALKDAEPFWSPPTRRVAQGLLPPLFIGMIAGILSAVCPGWDFVQPWGLPAFWMMVVTPGLVSKVVLSCIATDHCIHSELTIARKNRRHTV